MDLDLNQCRKIIRQNAFGLAKSMLLRRRVRFVLAETEEEAEGNWLMAKDLCLGKNDFWGAASCLMQNRKFFQRRDYIGLLETFAKELCRQGDRYFYDEGRYDEALKSYQLAVGLKPDCYEAMHEIGCVCLQGEPFRPEVALPYVVVKVSLNPSRRADLDYVLKRIAEKRS